MLVLIDLLPILVDNVVGLDVDLFLGDQLLFLENLLQLLGEILRAVLLCFLQLLDLLLVCEIGLILLLCEFVLLLIQKLDVAKLAFVLFVVLVEALLLLLGWVVA